MLIKLFEYPYKTSWHFIFFFLPSSLDDVVISARGYFPPHWSNRNIKEEKITRFRRRADAIVKETHSDGPLSFSIRSCNAYICDRLLISRIFLLYKLFENTVVKTFPFRLKYTLTHFPQSIRFFIKRIRIYSPSNRNIVRHFPRCATTQLLQEVGVEAIIADALASIRPNTNIGLRLPDNARSHQPFKHRFKLWPSRSIAPLSLVLLGLSVTEGAVKEVSSIRNG